MLGAGIGVTDNGQPAKFGIGTQVRLQFSPSYGPGSSGADEVAFIPYATDTASPTLQTKGVFRLLGKGVDFPSAGNDLIPEMSFHCNRDVRISRKIVQHSADANYWIKPQPNKESRIGHDYFSAWGGYFKLDPLKAFTLTHDDVDFHRDAWQPAFQWCRGEVVVHEPLTLDGKKPVNMKLGFVQDAKLAKIYFPDQTLTPEKPGSVTRTLKRGEWLTFPRQMGNGTLIPLDNGFTANAGFNAKGGSLLNWGYGLGERELKPGDKLSYSYLIMRWPTGAPAEEGLERKIVSLLGLDGSAGWQPKTLVGTVRADGFGFLATPKDGVVALDLPKAELSIGIPLRVAGLNPNWTAGTIRPGSKLMEPIAPDTEGVAWELLDTVKDAGRLFVGHPVLCDRREIVVQTLQRHGGGWTVMAHNPGAKEETANLAGVPGGPLEGFKESARLAPGAERRWVVEERAK
jgi:hypothetical protein